MVVDPVAMPVTVPEVPTDAIPVPALLQVPPVVLSDKGCVAPGQMANEDGLMGNGAGFTVTTAIAAQPVEGKV